MEYPMMYPRTLFLDLCQNEDLSNNSPPKGPARLLLSTIMTDSNYGKPLSNSGCILDVSGKIVIIVSK